MNRLVLFGAAIAFGVGGGVSLAVIVIAFVLARPWLAARRTAQARMSLGG